MPQTPIYALPYPAETDTADVPRDIQALANRLDTVMPGVGVPTGGGIDWWTPTPPTGFLICDGSAISRTSYAALWGVLGTRYGAGDGSTTFNLPDTRGRVIVGYAATGGHADVATLGANEGNALPNRRTRHAHTNGVTAGATHSLALPAHGHGVSDPGHGHNLKVATTPGAPYTAPVNLQYGPEDGTQGWPPTINPAATGISTGNPTSYPGINGAVTVTIGGGIGVGPGTLDTPSYVVAAKAIKT
jgi:microcystin-dependent protein